jgi:hypothetical protein
VTGLLPLLRDNLLSPPILFFALGVGARIARSDLEVPREVGRALAIYLMMSIGFKGGTALASGGVSWTLAAGCAAVVLLTMNMCVCGLEPRPRRDAVAVRRVLGGRAFVLDSAGGMV